MYKFKILFFIFIFYLLNIGNSSFAAINFSVSPIKFEIEAFTGTTISRTAKIYNGSNTGVTLITGKTDFQANGSGGVPTFVRKSELAYPDQVLSTWITLSIPSITVPAGQWGEMDFTITVPANATPGGHYGAVCFKNNNSESSTGGSNVGINVDYCTLILLNVDGVIVIGGGPGPTVISGGLGAGGINGNGYNSGSGNTSSPNGNNNSGTGNINTPTGSTVPGNNNNNEDNCIIDLTASKFDGKCIDDFGLNQNDNNSPDLNPNDNNTPDVDIDDSNFEITFNTPFTNNGNTHIKPDGKIEFIDEDGNVIKSIGEKVIVNDYGTIIGKEVVDYLPLNNEGGKVLPGQTRNYGYNWAGFPYQAYNEKGEIVTKYWTPSEYYTKKNTAEQGYLMPWQRVNERVNHKKITANINVSYIDINGEEVEFKSAEEFYIDYKEKYVGYNPYAFICLWFVIIILFFVWFILRKKKVKCINKKCSEKIDDDLKICPYCETKQNDKRYAKKKENKKKEKK